MASSFFVYIEQRQRNRSRRRGHTNSNTVAPKPAASGTACGRRVPTHSITTSRRFCRSLPHTRTGPPRSGVDSQIRSNGQPGAAAQFHRLTENDLRRAGKAGQLHHQQADGSPADHTYCTAGPYTCGIDTVQAARQRLAMAPRLKGQLRCQFEALCRRRCAVLCKPAVPGDAKRLQMLAELLFTVPAGRTRRSKYWGLRRHGRRRQTFHIRALLLLQYPHIRVPEPPAASLRPSPPRRGKCGHLYRTRRTPSRECALRPRPAAVFHIPDFKFPVAQKEKLLHRRSILSACSPCPKLFNPVLKRFQH